MRSERRFLSVLMCDLSDSTELSDRLDPDVFAKIIDTVINISADEIERFDGFISAYQGDSVIALFGYPTALEHHAAQAIRAGLSITTKIQQYNDTLDTSVLAAQPLFHQLFAGVLFPKRQPMDTSQILAVGYKVQQN